MQVSPHSQDGSFSERYDQLEELAQGGFGVVYRGRQKVTGQLVAIKRMRLVASNSSEKKLAEHRARFLREVDLISKLNSPHVVRLIDAGFEERSPYMVLEYVEGASLRDVLGAGPLSLYTTKRLMGHVLEAVSEAHERGIVHRDLKPANIMIQGTGRRAAAKVLDFGIAGFEDPFKAGEHQTITQEGQTHGTPSYMAPEQLYLFKKPVVQSDIYALGLIMLECLTGEIAIAGDSPEEIFLQHVEQTLDIPEAIVQGPFGPLIRRATEKNPNDRYMNAEAMLAELEDISVGKSMLRNPCITGERPMLDRSAESSDSAIIITRGSVKKHAMPGNVVEQTAGSEITREPIVPNPSTPREGILLDETPSLSMSDSLVYAREASGVSGQSAGPIPVAVPRRRWSARISMKHVLLGLLLIIAAKITLGFLGNRRKSPEDLHEIALDTFGRLPRNVPFAVGDAIAPDLVKLGRVLYYDERLSQNNTMSCNSCHPLDQYAVDNLPLSLSFEGKPTPRNTPTLYHIALHSVFKWDGTVSNLEEQCELPFLGKTAQGMEKGEHVEARLAGIPGYAPLFRAAFPTVDRPMTMAHVSLAVSAFLRTLNTRARFDDFIDGDLHALGEDGLNGLQLFIEEGCTTCHVDPTLGGTKVQKLGLINAYETKDLGLYQSTGQNQHRHVFKVASLRNVIHTGPYLHDGSIKDLHQVVRLMAYHQLDRELSDNDIEDIVSFLATLTGRIDPSHIARPELPPDP